jgi:glycosyltransferase involved in cell wall biosynthesis
VRLVWFTTDTDVFQSDSLAERRLRELSTLFNELHVIVLETRRRGGRPAVRLTDNVWLYSTQSRSLWWSPFDAARLAREQLAFAGGFRADVVVTDDPFEAGWAGYFTARRFERPLQVHVLTDYFSPDFAGADSFNGLRVSLAKHVIGKAACVRTKTVTLRDRFLYEHPHLKETVEVLPVYYDLAAWRDATPVLNVKELYPQFNFSIIHVTHFDPRSHTERVIHGVARTLLQYPTVGLIIIGTGPQRAAIEKLVVALGIQRQVVFVGATSDVLSYFKTANLFVQLSESAEDDPTVLQAACSKIPLILGNQGLPLELFPDGQSAFLCPVDDATCVSQRINQFLNDNLSRTTFALNAQEIVFSRIEQDYQLYLDAFKSSVERCVVTPS